MQKKKKRKEKKKKKKDSIASLLCLLLNLESESQKIMLSNFFTVSMWKLYPMRLNDLSNLVSGLVETTGFLTFQFWLLFHSSDDWWGRQHEKANS